MRTKAALLPFQLGIGRSQKRAESFGLLKLCIEVPMKLNSSWFCRNLSEQQQTYTSCLSKVHQRLLHIQQVTFCSQLEISSNGKDLALRCYFVPMEVSLFSVMIFLIGDSWASWAFQKTSCQNADAYRSCS